MTQMSDTALLKDVWPDYRPTPLLTAPSLAERLGLGHVYLKAETERPLGNFKSLGGMLAGLRVLMQSAGQPTLAALEATPNLPALICASDGNHGLAVAAAAHRVRGPAIICLPPHVSPPRVQRITALGAQVVRVKGTYDDAVDHACRLAQSGAGLLVPDTTDRSDDPVVALVMQGYGVMTHELSDQFAGIGAHPTHVFVQAGVGGLAASLAQGLSRSDIVVVEPQSADCVGRALAMGRPVRREGDLDTSADMLSCGLASTPAMEILLAYRAKALSLSEDELAVGPDLALGISPHPVTVSGAAGLAGLAKACSDNRLRDAFGLTAASRVLVILTERANA